MVQYCRYCSHCHYGDFCYCDVKRKVISDKAAKSTNKCKDFEFNEIDVFYGGDMNKKYKPRKQKEKQEYEQITIMKYINIGGKTDD